MSRRRRGRGEGSVFQRVRTLPSGTVVKDWCAKVSLGYDDAGKRVRRTFFASTKSEAMLKVEQARARSGGILTRAVTLTVQEYFEEWLSELERSRSPLTITGYRQRLALYAYPNIGKVRLDQLDSKRISWLYGILSERGVSADNTEKLHKALRRGFNVALAKGVINRNPVLHVERATHKPEKRPHMDAANVALFFAAIRGHRHEAMWRLGIMAMMRPGELFALAYDDLLLDRGLVDVRHNLENDQGRLAIVSAKADSMRRIPIEPEDIAVLRAHVEHGKTAKHGSPYVFVTDRGKWLREGPTNRALHAVLAAAGLPDLTMYSLRHTGASLGAEAGLHPRVVADIMGHSDTKITTEIYTHAGEAMHRSGVQSIGALVRNAADAA